MAWYESIGSYFQDVSPDDQLFGAISDGWEKVQGYGLEAYNSVVDFASTSTGEKIEAAKNELIGNTTSENKAPSAPTNPDQDVDQLVVEGGESVTYQNNTLLYGGLAVGGLLALTLLIKVVK